MKVNERKKNDYECLFLLCWKVGLRISEAVSFDLSLIHSEAKYKNLYHLRGKGKKDRWVFVKEEVIKELRKRNWKPKLGRNWLRINFWDFLEVVKKDLNISENIELSPHTLRRCFATNNALNGMPLPVLQKALGHNEISTTAIYIKDIELDSLVKFQPL